MIDRKNMVQRYEEKMIYARGKEIFVKIWHNYCANSTDAINLEKNNKNTFE